MFAGFKLNELNILLYPLDCVKSIGHDQRRSNIIKAHLESRDVV